MHKILLSLLLTLCLLVYSDSSPPGFTEFCKCFYHHPQTLLCRSDFIAKVRLLKSRKLVKFEDSHPWSWEYHMNDEDGEYVFMRDEFDAEILEVYERKSGNTNEIVKLLVFPLAVFTHGCPPTPFHKNAGETFVIGGTETDKGVKINGCSHFYSKWDDMSSSMKKLVKRGTYKANCQCAMCTEFQGGKKGKTCTDSNTNCVYDLNKDWKSDFINPKGQRGFSFWGCHMAAGYCSFDEKNKTCGWKFDRKGRKEHC